jgi:hypothetical protein
MNRRMLWPGVAGAALATLGCTVMRPLSVGSSQLSSSLHKGDHVELTMVSGQQLRFVIASVDETSLHGEGWDVSFSDIETIRRKEISAGRTALVALGVVAAAGAAAAAAAPAQILSRTP